MEYGMMAALCIPSHKGPNGHYWIRLVDLYGDCQCVITHGIEDDIFHMQHHSNHSPRCTHLSSHSKQGTGAQGTHGTHIAIISTWFVLLIFLYILLLHSAALCSIGYCAIVMTVMKGHSQKNLNRLVKYIALS